MRSMRSVCLIRDYHWHLAYSKPLMRDHGAGALPAHGVGTLASMHRLPAGLHCDLARASTPWQAEGDMNDQAVREGQLHSRWCVSISCTPACSMPMLDPNNLTGTTKSAASMLCPKLGQGARVKHAQATTANVKPHSLHALSLTLQRLGQGAPRPGCPQG